MRAETYEHDERVQARKSVAHAEEGSRTTTCSEAQPPMAAHTRLSEPVSVSRFAVSYRYSVPVKRHRGEPEHTRDTRVLYSVWFKDTGGSRDTHEQTQEPHKPTSKPTPPTVTHAPDHTRTPGRTRRRTYTTPLTRSSAVVVTEMATAPGRGSSEGASPTASVTGLFEPVPYSYAIVSRITTKGAKEIIVCTFGRMCAPRYRWLICIVCKCSACARPEYHWYASKFPFSNQ